MKKLLALLLTLVMCLSLAACGGSGTDTSGTDTSSGETGEDSGDSSYRVAMICDSSISDGGWGMSCYNAMVDAAAERGWATEVSDSIAQSAYYDTIISWQPVHRRRPSGGGGVPRCGLRPAERRRGHSRQSRQRQCDLPAAQCPAGGLDRRCPGRSYDQERHGGLHWRHGTGYHPGQV